VAPGPGGDPDELEIEEITPAHIRRQLALEQGIGGHQEAEVRDQSEAVAGEVGPGTPPQGAPPRGELSESLLDSLPRLAPDSGEVRGTVLGP